MTYNAYFIGGPFDLTKRILNKELHEVDFFEPLKDVSLLPSYLAPEPLVCNVLRYRLISKTRSGCLIYELE